MDKMRVEIDLSGHDVNCQNTVSDVICQQLLSLKDDFVERLSRVSNQFCPKAVVDMDSFNVDLADIQQDKGMVRVGFGYQSFHDFEDLQTQQHIKENWRFELAQQKAVFELDLPELHPVHEI
ncbi:hypothetical protein E2K93_01070 [Thalassotalea sp. HSM 43]|uniref:hypothetical protein n=1 Tax=Thalassotalea sp. HSM 43 TaxID=2552945 RepID=UPI001080B1DA|nr:hypothetical protein [Thalassotalea sp. HSM 43]QBY03044.1 hypothetical protein E2K93_01070 [Thalassotalea sp. HSM 43]